MFVIRKSWRWIDNSHCWAVFLDGTQDGYTYDKIVFDTFEEAVEWLNTSDAQSTWVSYHSPESRFGFL
jgi:hypothetical protein